LLQQLQQQQQHPPVTHSTPRPERGDRRFIWGYGDIEFRSVFSFFFKI